MLQHQFYSETYLPKVNQAVGDFVAELIWGDPDKFGAFCTMAIVNGDDLVAGVVYHNYQPDCGTIEISCASRSRKFMTRGIITAAMSMPFRDLGCQAIFARHSEENAGARHIWNSIGATEHIIPRLRGKEEPAEVVAVLTDDAWTKSRFNVAAAEESVS